jgi:hypothetical protein
MPVAAGAAVRAGYATIDAPAAPLDAAPRTRSEYTGAVPDDARPKSAFELAMERLREKDAQEGVALPPMTDEQKSAIAEVRRVYDARLAEQDILQQSAMRRPPADPAARDEVARQFRRERERLAGERDSKIDRLRRGEP